MARIRTIKPDFFKNEDLAELPAFTRLLFIGLWTQADREGKLEDRPKRIKAELFPYEDYDLNGGLDELQKAGLILRYKVGESSFIVIKTFLKHQQPNMKEAKSVIPNPTPIEHSASTVQASQEGKGKEREWEEERKEFTRDEFFEVGVLKFFGFSEMPQHYPQAKILMECCRANFLRDEYDFFKKQCQDYKIYIDLIGVKFKKNFSDFLGQQSQCFQDGFWRTENWAQKTQDRILSTNKGAYAVLVADQKPIQRIKS